MDDFMERVREAMSARHDHHSESLFADGRLTGIGELGIKEKWFLDKSSVVLGKSPSPGTVGCRFEESGNRS